MSEIDKLDVVRKLLAKAEGAATPEEAETYSAKAVELMARHGIDAAMLAAEKPGTDTIGGKRIEVDEPYGTVKAKLLGWLAQAMRCRAVLHTAAGKRSVGSVTLFGYASDRERVELLYTSLLLQATAQLSRLRAPYGHGVVAWRRGWFYGFAVEVYRRVKEIEDRTVTQAQAESAADGVPGAALVLADREALVDRAYEAAFSNLGKSRAPKVNGSAYVQGAVAGRRADLGGRRVGGGAKGELRG